MSGHTPGPWRKGARVPGRHAIRILDSTGLLAAEARAGGGPWSWAEANARLIVAAVNGCLAVNPDNPLAESKGLDVEAIADKAENHYEYESMLGKEA